MASDKIYVASDHNGNAARAHIFRLLTRLNYDFVDLGPSEQEGKVDYVDFAEKVCRTVLGDLGSAGILICGTGTGMSIVANRFPGIRAGIATDRATAYLMREHNDANVLVLGQWRNSLDEMEDIVRTFFETAFHGGRHVSRLKKLEDLRP